eukprot:TRINITY_DN34084_c0_g1_i1.p1 TRINITY_DN34084_c0_g1~~TRINITY_DN34084_c0_g1_i1.p1  ORF type:complete len:222 (-),score=61.94 TRINITY_DN34084_c0_g1_i1:39-704(-)
MPKYTGNVWNLSSCNRLVAERIEGRRHEKHVKALETSKGLVDHHAPKEQKHLNAKPKTRKLQEDRAAEIQLENRILLQKMLNIDTKPSPFSGEALMHQRVPPKSLNGESHRRELDRITNDNQALLRRLHGAQPSIDPNKWNDEEVDRQALKFRISQNASRGRIARLRMPEKTPMDRLPRIAGSGSAHFTEDEWTELSNAELDKHLHELEQMRGNNPSVVLK